jgi:hypothetical protein
LCKKLKGERSVPTAEVARRKRMASEGKDSAGISVQDVIELLWAQKIDSNCTIGSFAER